MPTPVANKNRAGLMGPEHVKQLDGKADQTALDAAATTAANATAAVKADLATVITANRTAIVGDKLVANTASGAIVVTLPVTPAAGTPVRVYRDGANTVTIARNGSTIEGAAEDLVLDEDKRGVRMTYLFGTWKAFPEVLA
ncbi:hypothetical protein GB927_012900 [Shinella sp. CPCC 100929]|uniref:Uncharacterized protein n=1 Tax=Shinella lacus TaxID=2654216 RepID=A0ABT1R6X8_9HYPH|nr:hypothetical protein [Shinella lacus]MCQ4630944.1 hypothetical protein [Shinella lacus]